MIVNLLLGGRGRSDIGTGAALDGGRTWFERVGLDGFIGKGAGPVTSSISTRGERLVEVEPDVIWLLRLGLELLSRCVVKGGVDNASMLSSLSASSGRKSRV